MNNEEKILELLGNLDKKVDRIDNRLSNLETKVDENSIDIKGIKEEHGTILRGIEEKLQIQSKSIEKIDFIEGDIKVIKNDILKIEQITANNWSDIVKLKSVNMR